MLVFSKPSTGSGGALEVHMGALSTLHWLHPLLLRHRTRNPYSMPANVNDSCSTIFVHVVELLLVQVIMGRISVKNRPQRTVKTRKQQQRNQHGATASTPTGFQTGASEFQPDCGATIHPNVQRLRRQEFLKKNHTSKKIQSDRKNKHELECNSSFVACKHQRKRAQDMLGTMHPCCR